jgi:threonylcarbamoyladenosine tRNA methylthiotransferase MtaB
MRIASHTLGCKLNSAETSAIVSQFRDRGWQPSDTESADVFVVNTCSVTANAERECRQLIRRALRKNPDLFVAVTGCYAQLRPEEIASIDGVDVVLGTKEKFSLFETVSDFSKRTTPEIFASDIADADAYHLAATSTTDERSRAFLKVQDGCDYTCSYCTIPMARGASRSGEIEQIVREAVQLCEKGFAEIVLSGVNVGDFKQNESRFIDLLRALEATDEVTARIRISSIEPNLLDDEIIAFIASSRKFCPHFHIPMQSGCDATLRRMQRRYTTNVYRERIEKVMALMPNAGIGADVIVGFPGETEDEFLQTYEFIRSLPISYLHVFTYSERPGTKASTLGGIVPKDDRKRRNEMLRILSEKLKAAYYHKMTGTDGIVLLEDGESGFTERYIRVRLSEPRFDAELLKVHLVRTDGEIVYGEPIEVVREVSSPVLLPILS